MSISKEFRDHARALLIAKTIDPNPKNLSKLVWIQHDLPYGDAIRLGLERKDYWVFANQSISNLLIEIILSHPLALNSKYLALFLTGIFKECIDFTHVVNIAENFKANPTRDSMYTLRQLLEMDKFVASHIEEMLVYEYGDVTTGIHKLASLQGFDESYQVTFHGKSYWILGIPEGLQMCNYRGINE